MKVSCLLYRVTFVLVRVLYVYVLDLALFLYVSFRLLHVYVCFVCCTCTCCFVCCSRTCFFCLVYTYMLFCVLYTFEGFCALFTFSLFHFLFTYFVIFVHFARACYSVFLRVYGILFGRYNLVLYTCAYMYTFMCGIHRRVVLYCENLLYKITKTSRNIFESL